MDAYDIRMSTFGGSQAKHIDKSKAYDQFISEKRGFIRTSNGFYNNDPLIIVNEEKNERILAPGPAFECNYDNKYREGTSFSNDLGRFKQALNTN